jgi:hypothetical protein
MEQVLSLRASYRTQISLLIFLQFLGGHLNAFSTNLGSQIRSQTPDPKDSHV